MLAYLALCVTLFIRPAGGRVWFFGDRALLVAILFFAAPGLWRATSRWPPGTGRGGRAGPALAPPDWLRRYGGLISIVLCLRDHQHAHRLLYSTLTGRASACWGWVTIISTFITGIALEGKSGWCAAAPARCWPSRASISSQRPRQTSRQPLRALRRGARRTATTSGPASPTRRTCTKPTRTWTAPRKLFVSALPGCVLGFFSPSETTPASRFPRFTAAGRVLRGQRQAGKRCRRCWPVEHTP